METKGMIVLERIAGNLPAQDIEFFQAPTVRGNVYIALGRGPGVEFPGESWHGVYGFTYGDDQGMARTGEVNGELNLQEARKQFIDDAAEQLKLFGARDMLDHSYRLDDA